jgi:hypothetical protein
MSNKIIWLIDENQDELRTYQEELSAVLQNDLTVKPIIPYKSMEDYIEPILNDKSTVTIIIDQRLKETGEVNYTGIELAEYLRAINQKMPIYILTNHPDDDFADKETNVEYILIKGDFKNESTSKMMAARILRRINIYTDIFTVRGKKFNELLKKSLSQDLSEDEYKELEQLNYLRLSSTLTSELAQVRELEKIISENTKLLDQLKGENKND